MMALCGGLVVMMEWLLTTRYLGTVWPLEEDHAIRYLDDNTICYYQGTDDLQIFYKAIN